MMIMHDELRTLAELKAQHARLWYELYGLLKFHGLNMSAMSRYPCVYTWTEAIAYARELAAQGNHEGVAWLINRSRDVNAAVQAMIDKVYTEIEYKGDDEGPSWNYVTRGNPNTYRDEQDIIDHHRRIRSEAEQ